MGVQGLAGLIVRLSPNAVNNHSDRKVFSGKTVAVDASNWLYQWLTAKHAKRKAHLSRALYHNNLLLSSGIRPIYVFDGRPPSLKSGVLENRAQKRAEAEQLLKEAEARKDLKTMSVQKKRLIRVGSSHVKELKTLLELTGVPFMQAPAEAEAQCATLVREGKANATATQDMDALTFGSEVVIRGLAASNIKNTLQEFNLAEVLEKLNINQNEFIDLSILLGCDYCDTINKVGPITAIKLIKRHRNIETIIKHIKRIGKYIIPDNWRFEEARNMFLNPLIKNCEKSEFIWGGTNISGVIDYMCGEHKFSEATIQKSVAILTNAIQIAERQHS